MKIKSKVNSKVHGKGGVNANQLCITLQKATVEASGIKKDDAITVTVIENGSILIEKVAKK